MPGRLVTGMLCVLLAAALSAAVPARAAEFHSSRWEYKLDLPADWRPIPDEGLQSMLAAAKAAGARPTVVFDAGFQPASGKWTFDGPYVVVQVFRYNALAVYHPVGENDFDHVMRLVIGQSGMRGAYADPSQQAGAPAPRSHVGEPSLDKAGRKFSVGADVDVPGRGTFKGLLTGYFRPDAVVLVCYAAPANRADFGAAHEIADSLRFEAPRPVAAPRVDPERPAGRASGSGDGPTPQGRYVLENARNQAINYSILGAIIGAGTAFKAYRSRRRRNEGDDAPPPSPPDRPL